jgi:hypothetical protein
MIVPIQAVLFKNKDKEYLNLLLNGLFKSLRHMIAGKDVQSRKNLNNSSDTPAIMAIDHGYDIHLLEPSRDICKDCINWKDFKEKCWYFWEKKKECSQRVKL